MPFTSSPFYEPDPNLLKAQAEAENVLRWCMGKLNVQRPPLPIPVDLWVETLFQLRLSVSDLSSLGADIEGGLDTRTMEIHIDQKLCDNDSRFRFACAHELGHLRMHQDSAKVFHQRTHIHVIHRAMHERQADRFAMIFLTPLRSLFDRLIFLAERQNVDRAQFLDALMADSAQDEQLWSEMVVPDLQAVVGVDRPIIVTRFSSLQTQSDRQPFMPKPVARKLCPDLNLDFSPPRAKTYKKSQSATLFDNV